MSAFERSGTALVRTWVRAYTSGLPESAKSERRAELESDLWEQVHEDPASMAVGPHILLRALLGVPADLTWRLEQATIGERIGHALAAMLERMERISSWAIQRGLPGLTTILAWLFIFGGILLVVLTPFQASDSRGIAVLGAWGILAGLSIRWGRSRIERRPRAGFLAVAAGAVPLGALLAVTIVAPVLALVVVLNEGRRSWRAWQYQRHLRPV